MTQVRHECWTLDHLSLIPALPQMASGMVAYGKPPLLPTPTKAGVAMATQGQPTASQALPSSTTQPGQHSKAQADSSKKEKVTRPLLFILLSVLAQVALHAVSSEYL